LTTVITEEAETPPERCFTFRDAVLTDVGRRRSENQDAYGIAHSEHVSLFFVADGMGGARGGATASSIAVRVIPDKAFLSSGLITEESLRSSIELCNSVIFTRSRDEEDLSGMGTTVVAAAFIDKRVIFAHVGDSRIYHWRSEVLTQVTRDHTLVQELVDTGAIAEEEAENHPIAHMLTRSLGPTEKVEVETSELDGGAQVGDQFLLCSDGLYNLVSAQEICSALNEQEPDEAVKTLVDLALERGGTDNVTVEILKIKELSQEEDASRYPTNSDVTVVAQGNAEVQGLEELVARVLGGGGASGDDHDEIPDESDVGGDDVEQPDDSLSVNSTGGFTVERELMKMRAGVFVVVLVILSAVSYSLFQFQKIRSRDGATAAAKSPKVASSSPTAKDVEKAVLERRQELVRELNDLIEEEPSNDQDFTSEDKPSSERTTSETQSSDESAEGLIPQGGSTEDSRVVLADIEEPEAPEVGIDKEIQEPTDVDVDKVVGEIDPLSEEEPPEVKIEDERVAEIPANQPIVWENEESKFARLRSNPDSTGKDLPTPEAEEKVVPYSLLTEKERLSVSDKKVEVRLEIASLDARIANLGLESKEAAEEKNKAIRAKRTKAKKALSVVQNEIAQLRKQYNGVLDISSSADSDEITKSFDKLGLSVHILADRGVALSRAQEGYDKAIKAWKKEPGRLELSSAMSARLRELRGAEAEHRAATRDLLEKTREDIRSQFGQRRYQEERVKNTVASLNRQIGYLDAFTPLRGSSRKEMQQKYLKERNSHANELKRLRAQLADEKEEDLMTWFYSLELDEKSSIGSNR
jgi:protein phosphatase